jgi:hypothetical protein
MADLELLTRLGTELTHRPQRATAPASPTIEDLLIEGLLKVRSKNKGLVRRLPHRAQGEYARRTSC